MLNYVRYLKDLVQGKTVRGAQRSSQWRKVRAVHLEKNPLCAVCGGNKKLEVHHIVPFHVAPELELNPENLITLCENKQYGINCHLLVGHLGLYTAANPDCLQDAKTWSIKLRSRSSVG